MADEAAQLDALDHRIIAALRANARTTNRAMASRFSVAESTVAVRIRRLSELRVMRVVAEADMISAGYDVFLSLGVYVSGRPIAEVAHELAGIPEVTSIASVLGRYDLMMTVLARDSHHLLEVLERRIAPVNGIVGWEAELPLDILRFRSELAYFED